MAHKKPIMPYAFVLEINNEMVVRIAHKAYIQSKSPFASETEARLQKFILQHCYSDVFDWVMKHSRSCHISFKEQQFRLTINNPKLEALFRLTFPEVPLRKHDR